MCCIRCAPNVSLFTVELDASELYHGRIHEPLGRGGQRVAGIAGYESVFARTATCRLFVGRRYGVIYPLTNLCRQFDPLTDNFNALQFERDCTGM
jgi:hypothetical protein